MKKFCECLKKHVSRIINFKKEKVRLLTNEHKTYEKAKLCYICGKNFEDKYAYDKKHRNFRDRCYYSGECRGAAHSICNLK